MNAEKTPLVQKLILGVLSLILVCLVVLIAQNRGKQSASAPEISSPTDEQEPVPSQVQQPEVAPRQPLSGSAGTPRPTLQPQAARALPAEPLQSPHIQRQPEAAPPPFTTLVNPVGREPLEIVLRAEAPVLRTEICGRVRLDGTPPQELPIRMDAKCARLHEGPITTRHYVVGPDRGLANVFVYVKGDVPKRYFPSAATAPPIISATACFFEPYLLGMQTGQKLTLQNLDNMRHNFHSLSQSNRNFNVALLFPGHTTQRGFENPEVFVRLKCDVHSWESAYMGVVPHPFFAVTDTNGVFCLPAGLPHGHYVLVAVHPKAGEVLREIVVGDEPATMIELALNVPRR